MTKITENLFFFIFLVLFSQTCRCTNPPPICSPSACGNIHNISFPFRLKNDPKECGDPRYELSCENNVTTISNLEKYEVKEIDYDKHTIRVADVSVFKNNSCSFPNVSSNLNFLDDYPYRIDGIWAISLMRCPYRVKDSFPIFTELPTHCEASNPSTHTYITIWGIKASDVGENCTMGHTGITTWDFRDPKNVSISEIHDSLLYGFQLYWTIYDCKWCNGREECPRNSGDVATCNHSLGALLQNLWDHIKYPGYGKGASAPIAAVVLILLLILGLTIPAKIILGFASASVFIIIEMNQGRRDLCTHWLLKHFHIILGLFFAVRFIFIFPCIIWFFIYKFRRRHLSRFAAIEDFLQSENNFMPMRYSYSDIKKMTRGFRDKLGQGGYGTVYKGKLRSGYDVAVKQLGKPGGNGQDFMNEISTIGRIHHVNVVKLVGYCAERSKRALVFDYMPNGSLDKYLYSRENCLSWGRKYEIAIGVARGIEYLHRGCDIQILHFDIKPHNILLDGNFTPKITDFGLAKFFSPEKKVVTMTAIRGTIGYVAPEIINRGFGEVSYKADVYSFGMLLMEIVGLNKHLKGNNQSSSQYFPDWIYDCFEQGHDIEIEELIDENDNGTNKEIAKKMTIVALWCIQTSPGDRPSMNKVVEMLEAKVERLRVPNRPSELARVAVNYEDQSLTTYSTDSVSLVPHDATPSVEITVED